MGLDSVDGIATRYDLDGQGIECWWRPDFTHISRPVLEPIQTPVQWAPNLLSRLKAVGAWH
jgi:hypothetical protein